MSIHAENSVISSLNELMRIEEERVREEEALDLEQKRQERERVERQRAAALEESARLAREESARKVGEAEARVKERLALQRALAPQLAARIDVVSEEPPANVDGHAALPRRRLRRLRLALGAVLVAWVGSVGWTAVAMKSAADEDKRQLVARFDAARDESTRARGDLERRIVDYGDRLRQATADLEDARRRLATASVAPAREEPKTRRPDSRITPHGAARRSPTCDPHDPLCGELP